jgi:hypothetical protein
MSTLAKPAQMNVEVLVRSERATSQQQRQRR